MNCESFLSNKLYLNNNNNNTYDIDFMCTSDNDVQRDSGNSSRCSSTIISSAYSNNIFTISSSSNLNNSNYSNNIRTFFEQHDLTQNQTFYDKDDDVDVADSPSENLNYFKKGIDSSLINDDRCLQNLLNLENYYRINSNYFFFVQNEIKPWMRKMLAKWMLEVCKNQSRENDIFALSMNILDRFLSVQLIGKRHLQLLGTVCMFIAAKLRSAQQFSAETLTIYTANSITIDELLNWEQFVLQKLRWDVCSITPNDFLPFLFKKLNLVNHKCIYSINECTQNFISLCSTEFKFSMISPSIIATSCLYGALKFLNINSENFLSQINIITSVDSECLKECIQKTFELIETTLMVKIKNKIEHVNSEKIDNIFDSNNNEPNSDNDKYSLEIRNSILSKIFIQNEAIKC